MTKGRIAALSREYEAVYIFDSALEDAAINDKIAKHHGPPVKFPIGTLAIVMAIAVVCILIIVFAIPELTKPGTEPVLSIDRTTHDFGIIGRMCDRVGVMYRGKIVETGDAREILREPKESYTRSLLESVKALS